MAFDLSVGRSSHIHVRCLELGLHGPRNLNDSATPVANLWVVDKREAAVALVLHYRGTDRPDEERDQHNEQLHKRDTPSICLGAVLQLCPTAAGESFASSPVSHVSRSAEKAYLG